MDTEGAFNLALRRGAIHSLSVSAEGDDESEVSGTIGGIREVSVVDGGLLVIRGSAGTLRLALPPRFLQRFGPRSAGR